MITRFIKWFKALFEKIFYYFFPSKNFKNSAYWKKPIFQSSFIQYWYSKDWDIERWDQELSMLNDIGIKEVIIQFIADTKEKYAVYHSEISGFKNNEVDMLERALTAADSKGMKVRVGLGISDDWWRKSAKKSWLEAEAEINKAIIDEVSEKYGYHVSFTGWYIPYEFYEFSAYTKRQYSYLNNFFKTIATEIKEKLPKDIMIAPYYYGKFPWMMYLPRWRAMLKIMLKGTGIDILALQDSIGANFNKLGQLPRIYHSTKKTLDEIGIKFYVDAETFTWTYSGFKPAAQNRIEKQLIIAKCYAQGFVAFSINHYQNGNEPDQVKYYNEYYRYYIENK